MSASRTVAIAGAGIGGLTAALALSARGFHVIVMEKADRLDEIGAGLQLSPNASHILIALGLREALAARATVPEAVSVLAGRGDAEVVRIPLGGAAEYHGAPYWVIHRADLQAVLREAVQADPRIELRLGSACTGYVVANGGVRAATAHGDVAAAALIGADGVHSTVRRLLCPQTRPCFAGIVAWRGTAPLDGRAGVSADRNTRLWLGAGMHMVAYPISGGALNVVAFTPGTWHGEGWRAPGDAAEFARILAANRWSGEACRLAEAVGSWTRWALHTVDGRRIGARGPVALIGDAAHAMLPFAAQGAAMAIEDAAVLARCLAATPDDPAAACGRYAAARAARAARVQRTAARNGQIYHLGGAAAWARDRVMRALGGRRLLARQDWIYRWRADG